MQTVVLTSGTLSPIDLYPQLLDFNPVASRSLQMTLTRECLCPVVLTRGADQMPVSSKFESRKDKNVLRCALSIHTCAHIHCISATERGKRPFKLFYAYFCVRMNNLHGLGIAFESLHRMRPPAPLAANVPPSSCALEARGG